MHVVVPKMSWSSSSRFLHCRFCCASVPGSRPSSWALVRVHSSVVFPFTTRHRPTGHRKSKDALLGRSVRKKRTPSRSPDGMTAEPSYTLYYWPIPGRGIFVRSLFAYTSTPVKEAGVEEIIRIKDAPFEDQPVPLRAPPFLVDHSADDFAVSQLSAVGTYVAHKLGLMPLTLEKQTLALKVLSDANDVLAEMWRANADFKLNGEWVLWDQPAWDEFRESRFVRWLQQFEAMGTKYKLGQGGRFLLGTPEATLADLACWSLWGTMARCLPELAPAMHEHAPKVMAMCVRLEESSDGLRALVAHDAKAWGSLWCGGLIERSLRSVVAAGVDGRGGGQATPVAVAAAPAAPAAAAAAAAPAAAADVA